MPDLAEFHLRLIAAAAWWLPPPSLDYTDGSAHATRSTGSQPLRRHEQSRPESRRRLLMATAAERLRQLYRAFNAHDIDAVLQQMTDDVDWPNAWEGGRVKGQRRSATTGTGSGAPPAPTAQSQSRSTKGTVALSDHPVWLPPLRP